jgi:hypothetical protein
MKTLKFRDYLVPLILSGSKTATWRLFDDKDLAKGDAIQLLEFGKPEPFAEATITRILEKPLGELTDQDKLGHETFKTDEEMYETFSSYYKKPVNQETLVKIIHFTLV